MQTPASKNSPLSPSAATRDDVKMLHERIQELENRLNARSRSDSSSFGGCGDGVDKTPQDGIEWGYADGRGPSVWGKLSSSFYLADEGLEQSPINIFEPETEDLPKDRDAAQVDIRYRDCEAVVRNTGRTIQVDWTAGEGHNLVLDGVEYSLVQFHFHSPAEHTLNGVRYPLEMHMVHSSEQGNLAVVGVLFQEGEESKFFDQFWTEMPENPEGGYRKIDNLSAECLKLKTSEFYRYRGSLTTPPCSENVEWVLLKRVETASPEQMARFNNCIPFDNYRPVQPVNNRKIYRTC